MLVMALSAVFSIQAQRKYYDAVIEDLKGHVKQCTIYKLDDKGNRESNLLGSDLVYTYNEDGTIASDYTKFLHNPEGLPTAEIQEQMTGGLGILFGVGGSVQTVSDTTTIVYKTNSAGTRIFAYSGDKKLIFDKAGNMVQQEDNSLYGDTYTYKILATDSHGNWTKCEVERCNDKNEIYRFCQEREITYWDGNFPNTTIWELLPIDLLAKESDYPATGNFREPDRELTITDMMHRPFGVIDVPNGDIWSLTYTDALKELSRRTNWELAPTTTRDITIYGNRLDGEKKDKGYNLTFLGEPLFSVGGMTFSEEFESFDFCFHRYKVGKKPKDAIWNLDDRWEIAPKWTKDEAFAFAQKLTAAVESTGLKMKKARKLDGDIYSMAAEDATSFYRVRIFKSSSKPTWFMVELKVMPLAEGRRLFL